MRNTSSARYSALPDDALSRIRGAQPGEGNAHVVSAPPPEFHYISYRENEPTCRLTRQAMPLDEHNNACDCGSGDAEFRQVATMWPRNPSAGTDARFCLGLVFRELVGWIIPCPMRLRQNLPGRRLGLRCPSIHARIAWAECSKGSRRQDAIRGDGQFLPAHLPDALSQGQRQAFCARRNIAKTKFGIRKERDATLGAAPGKIQRHRIGKGCVACCKPSGDGNNNEPS